LKIRVSVVRFRPWPPNIQALGPVLVTGPFAFWSSGKLMVGDVFIGRGVEQLAARRAHNPKVAGSSPAPATKILKPLPGNTPARVFFRVGGNFGFFMRAFVFAIAVALASSACSVVAVADATITVLATTVKVGATVVETSVDVAAAGVKAVAGSDDDKNE
jgi:hypothetical protein